MPPMPSGNSSTASTGWGSVSGALSASVRTGFARPPRDLTLVFLKGFGCQVVAPIVRAWLGKLLAADEHLKMYSEALNSGKIA
eukprot:10077429-Lingulodinium_polyedra.AAC.1